MSENTWGDLPKSQVDNQLITEAITQAIANHESDPEAHLGDGESLQQHKSNEVIDHPAQSVVADKPAPYLSGSLLFQEDGRGSNAWIINLSGADNEVTPQLFGIILHGENATATRADVAISFAGYNTTYATEISYLEFFANFSSSNSLDSWVCIGYGDIYTSSNGYGFRYKESDGHLYAFHKVGSTFYDTDLGAPPVDEFHKYRVNLESNQFTFYIDDLLVATHSTNMPTGVQASLLTFGVVPHTSNDGTIYIRFLEYYQSSFITIDP